LSLRGGFIVSEIKYGIEWDEKYSIGYEHVDLQHRRLFELLSDLITASMNHSDTDQLKKTIDFLVDYTVKHFYDEESVQVQWNYPEYEKHKQIHEDFKGVVTGIVQKYNENGSSTELNNDVNKIIVRWIVNHIQNEDKKIGEFIRKKESRFGVD
jgi:hemerythrin